MKNEAPEARKIHKIGTWSRLGGSWSGSWRPGRDFLGISAHVGAKMGARWAKLGPSWQQVATKRGHDSAKMAILGSTWEVLGACWEHFGTILAHGLDSRKPTKTEGKHRFFGILGCLKRWLKHFFGDVGSKMAFFGHLESTCGTCWRQDGQQDGQDGQHEGQDGRKEAKRGRFRS